MVRCFSILEVVDETVEYCFIYHLSSELSIRICNHPKNACASILPPVRIFKTTPFVSLRLKNSCIGRISHSEQILVYMMVD